MVLSQDARVNDSGHSEDKCTTEDLEEYSEQDIFLVDYMSSVGNISTKSPVAQDSCAVASRRSSKLSRNPNTWGLHSPTEDYISLLIHHWPPSASLLRMKALLLLRTSISACLESRSNKTSFAKIELANSSQGKHKCT